MVLTKSYHKITKKDTKKTETGYKGGKQEGGTNQPKQKHLTPKKHANDKKTTRRIRSNGTSKAVPKQPKPILAWTSKKTRTTNNLHMLLPTGEQNPRGVPRTTQGGMGGQLQAEQRHQKKRIPSKNRRSTTQLLRKQIRRRQQQATNGPRLGPRTRTRRSTPKKQNKCRKGVLTIGYHKNTTRTTKKGKVG